MQAFYGTRISPHISETPEGFLVCHSAPLCRTGYQKYKGSELGLRTDDLVDVYRSPDVVFDRGFTASLNGKPICDRHPEEFLNADNAKWYMRGHVQNVQPGPLLPDGEQSVIGDLMITDPSLIQKIKSGVRDLSVGYTCEYSDNGDGTYSQTRLRANHVAVVESGRAGEHVRIMDGVTEEMLNSSESRSFDDLADEIRQSYNPSDSEEEDDDETEEEGFTMPKTDHLETMVRRIVTQEIAKLMPREQSLVEEVADAHPPLALAKLRLLRPLIEASRDAYAIDAYNRAIRAVKKLGNSQSSHLVSAVDSLRVADGSNEFVTAINRARARLLDRPETEPEKKVFGTRAADSTSRSDGEEWGKDANAMGRRMREGKIR